MVNLIETPLFQFYRNSSFGAGFRSVAKTWVAALFVFSPILGLAQPGSQSKTFAHMFMENFNQGFDAELSGADVSGNLLGRTGTMPIFLRKTDGSWAGAFGTWNILGTRVSGPGLNAGDYLDLSYTVARMGRFSYRLSRNESGEFEIRGRRPNGSLVCGRLASDYSEFWITTNCQYRFGLNMHMKLDTPNDYKGAIQVQNTMGQIFASSLVLSTSSDWNLQNLLAVDPALFAILYLGSFNE